MENKSNISHFNIISLKNKTTSSLIPNMNSKNNKGEKLSLLSQYYTSFQCK